MLTPRPPVGGIVEREIKEMGELEGVIVSLVPGAYVITDGFARRSIRSRSWLAAVREWESVAGRTRPWATPESPFLHVVH